MLTGIIGDDRAAAEPDAVRELVNALGRLPLALRIAGAVLVLHRHRPVGFLLDRLRTRNPLDELSHGDLALRPRLAASYGQLTEVEQHVFRRVGAVTGASFDIGTAAEVAGVGPEIVEKAIDRLLEMHLVEPAGSGNRFRMDGIVHAYARERLSEHD
jgi:hypothetical protein